MQSFWSTGLEYLPARRGFMPHTLSYVPVRRYTVHQFSLLISSRRSMVSMPGLSGFKTPVLLLVSQSVIQTLFGLQLPRGSRSCCLVCPVQDAKKKGLT